MNHNLTIDRGYVYIFNQQITRPDSCGVIQWLEFWENVGAFTGKSLEDIEAEAYNKGYDEAEKEHAGAE